MATTPLGCRRARARARARDSSDAGRVGVHSQDGPGLRRRQPVTADQPEQLLVFRAQRRQGCCWLAARASTHRWRPRPLRPRQDLTTGAAPGDGPAAGGARRSDTSTPAPGELCQTATGCVRERCVRWRKQRRSGVSGARRHVLALPDLSGLAIQAGPYDPGLRTSRGLGPLPTAPGSEAARRPEGRARFSDIHGDHRAASLVLRACCQAMVRPKPTWSGTLGAQPSNEAALLTSGRLVAGSSSGAER